MRIVVFILLGIISVPVSAQYGYWQQRVEYKMDIDFDAQKHQFRGKQDLTYYNNSPDTLYKVYYHLYFNAFQPGSSMDVRSRTIADPDRRVGDRISQLKPDEIGYQKILSLRNNNDVLSYTVQGTILEVVLKKPVMPRSKTSFQMEFEGQVPVQIRRSGRNSADGVEYSMTQWYPKMCEYDYEGWHADPYIGREFYGVYGDFEVSISIDNQFTIGATGVLQNPQETGKGYEDKSKPVKKQPGNKTNWRFVAKNVHDFAWAADKDYVHDIQQVPNGPVLHFIYQPDKSQENWKKLQPYMIQFFELMNKNFGKYPYEQFSFIQGGDGGMEYPMITLVTSRGSLSGLIGVSVHEAIHNWYYGVLGTNESKYPWMDEGFTTYAQDFILDILFNIGQPNPHTGSYESYKDMIRNGEKEPLTTHSDFYHLNSTYGTSAYSAGAVFLHQLSYVVGMESFRAGMLRYFEEWKFKHPAPVDFIRVMEKTSQLELDWYLENFIGTLNEIDYGIKSVVPEGGNTRVILGRFGSFPMPLDVHVKFKQGKEVMYYIPLDLMRGEKSESMNSKAERKILSDWPWVYKEYTFTIQGSISDIESITIDPSERLCDIDAGNNSWPSSGEIRFESK